MRDTAPPRAGALFDVDPPVRRPAPEPRRRGAGTAAAAAHRLDAELLAAIDVRAAEFEVPRSTVVLAGYLLALHRATVAAPVHVGATVLDVPAECGTGTVSALFAAMRADDPRQALAVGRPVSFLDAERPSDTPPAESVLLLAVDGARMVLTSPDGSVGGEWPHRWLRRVVVALGALAHAPAEASLRTLDTLPAEERDLVIGLGSPAMGEPARVDCLHLMIEDQVDRTPDAVAVRAGDRTRTYAELDCAANRLAHRLLAHGVGPDRRVGVCLPRTTELVVTLLAVLKAGAAYVPLDPAYPAERIAYMATDSGCALLVTQAGQDCPEVDDVPTLLVDDETDTAGTANTTPDHRPNVGTDPTRLAYVIYTSGSTGRPKGVAIEHRSAAVLMRWVRETFDDGELAGMLASTSVCFDLSVFEIFGPLCWGGSFRLVHDVLALADPDPDPVPDVTVVSTVPSAMNELLAADAVPLSVRTVCLAGEALTPALARRVHERAAGTRLLNLYGPSEDTTYSTWAPVLPGEDPTIGRPLPHTRAYVLDEEFRLVPLGAAGELYLAGAGLARGYLGRPEETAARFLPDPFGPGRMYRTGDRVRLRADGRIDFLGRADDQVKLRGHRIELGEVSAALAGAAGVRHAVASVVPGPSGEPRLVGHLVVDEGTEDADVLACVRGVVPGYMVPSALVRLPRLPMTPNGKVNRAALPASDWPGVAVAGSALEGLAATVARVWREVLGVSVPGAEADFLALGGDSLLATRCAARLRSVLGVRVSPAALFDHPTVAELADHLRAMAPDPSVSAVDAVIKSTVEEWHATAAQRRLWLLHRVTPDDTSYLVSFAVHIRGAVDADALVAAFGDVVARHAALRSVFTLADAALLQRLGPTGPVCRCAVAGPLDEALRDFAARDAAAGMDLETGPLLRARLVTGPSDHAVLLLTVHHIVFDDWSLGVLVDDLAEHYALRTGIRDIAPESVPTPSAIAEAEARWLAGPRGPAAGAELIAELRGAPMLLDLPAGTEAEPGDRSVVESIAEPVAAAVRRLAAEHRASLYMVGLAAFGTLLAAETGRDDLLVASAFAGRTSVEAERVIGCLINTVPLRLRPTPETTFAEMIAQARRAALFAAEHQDVPFDAVLAGLRPPRERGRTPLVQVAFGVQNAAPAHRTVGAVEFDGVELVGDQSRLDLTLWLDERRGGLSALWTRDAARYGRADVAAWHRRYTALLDLGAREPTRTVRDLATLTASEPTSAKRDQ